MNRFISYKNNLTSRKTDAGFTIVELLVVIVVIAILAAITVVGYSGVTTSAKDAATKLSAQQAAKKIIVSSAIGTGLYPADLATAGITNTDSTTYRYTVDNTASPATFCVSATTDGISYSVRGTGDTTPLSGACPRAWASKGDARAGCGANCNFVRFSYESFPAGNYQVRCAQNGSGFGSYTTQSLSAGGGTIQLLCYVASPMQTSVSVQITGYGLAEPVNWL